MSRDPAVISADIADVRAQVESLRLKEKRLQAEWMIAETERVRAKVLRDIEEDNRAAAR